MHRGWQLRLYLSASHLFPLFARRLLRRRLARGKEHPDRWREKLAQNLAPRPKGTLIWLHAVGLGEVLSLRGLIARMAARDPTAHFLVTSSTLASAEVLSKNMPPRTLHQFLPLDAPAYHRAFLDHFRPDLALWAEQDLWPGFVSGLAKRAIPQAIIAARMNANSFEKHHKAAGLYRDLYGAMQLITAQDEHTIAHLVALGAGDQVALTGSLKPTAPPLGHDAQALAALQVALAGRTVWAVAPSHAPDEAIALEAHAKLRATHPDALLIIAPRHPDRAADIATQIPAKFRSRDDIPTRDDPIWICDSFGELGLIYRLASLVLIGGTFGDTEGHSPWEAAALGCAVAHGPRVANFAADYALLDQAGGARQIKDAADLLALLHDSGDMVACAADTIAGLDQKADQLAADLLRLAKVDHD
ncbi:3-deoxy-D-manno-octulosonic-acid transferase [Yoonia sediminilitoris]|uniref:3-deoxy-D-manno-octulosonic acid transferase n=2 Tax=Yoonia sediminilitoris TaxID=1286148 RepID=A0A2T6KJY7_9RHOB|nr:3-deoxy-D-manno-octulosonic-acid transferase [Yoonia sediminilitoris]RCW96627.1 3-deoxy-D-manno-octulosonic-acid transferase [Yoonia sediminilitoris]